MLFDDAGAGCMVAAVCATTEKEPVVVGKPSPFMMDFLVKRLSFCQKILHFKHVRLKF